MTLRLYFLSFLVPNIPTLYPCKASFPVGYFKGLTPETMGMDLLFWVLNRGVKPTRGSLEHEPAFWKSLKVSLGPRDLLPVVHDFPFIFVGWAPRLLPQIVPTSEAIAGRRNAPALASLFPGPVRGNWCLGDSGWGPVLGTLLFIALGLSDFYRPDFTVC